MVLPVLLAAAVGAAGWVPARWSSHDPKTLELVAETPVNCLLVEEDAWSPAFSAAAGARGIVLLGVVHAPADAAAVVKKARAAELAGLVLEGDFDPDAGAAYEPAGTVIHLPPRSAMRFDRAAPVVGTDQGVWPGVRVGGQSRPHRRALDRHQLRVPAICARRDRRARVDREPSAGAHRVAGGALLTGHLGRRDGRRAVGGRAPPGVRSPSARARTQGARRLEAHRRAASLLRRAQGLARAEALWAARHRRGPIERRAALGRRARHDRREAHARAPRAAGAVGRGLAEGCVDGGERGSGGGLAGSEGNAARLHARRRHAAFRAARLEVPRFRARTRSRWKRKSWTRSTTSGKTSTR